MKEIRVWHVIISTVFIAIMFFGIGQFTASEPQTTKQAMVWIEKCAKTSQGWKNNKEKWKSYIYPKKINICVGSWSKVQKAMD